MPAPTIAQVRHNQFPCCLPGLNLVLFVILLVQLNQRGVGHGAVLLCVSEGLQLACEGKCIRVLNQKPEAGSGCQLNKQGGPARSMSYARDVVRAPQDVQKTPLQIYIFFF